MPPAVLLRPASVASLVLALSYCAAQLAEWLGWLGSTGGPHSTSTAGGLALLLTPSLLLGPCFVTAAAAIAAGALDEAGRAASGLAGLAFAAIYATLTGAVYFIQLSFVLPRIGAQGDPMVDPFRFLPFRSALYSVDLIGYSFMSLATIAMAAALPASFRVARLALFANGALLPALVGQLYLPDLIWVGAGWAITFPLAMAALALRPNGPATPAAA